MLVSSQRGKPIVTDEQINSGLKWARFFARRYCNETDPLLSAEDLVQEGMIGFLGACARHDPSTGASLMTYVKYRIKGAMLDKLTEQRFGKRLPPGGTTLELGDAGGVIGENGKDWDDVIYHRQVMQVIANSLSVLPTQQRDIMTKIYFEGVSAAEVARIKGISESNVSIQHARAIEKIKTIVINKLGN